MNVENTGGTAATALLQRPDDEIQIIWSRDVSGRRRNRVTPAHARKAEVKMYEQKSSIPLTVVALAFLSTYVVPVFAGSTSSANSIWLGVVGGVVWVITAAIALRSINRARSARESKEVEIISRLRHLEARIEELHAKSR
jgi:hypothetical protein